MWPFTSSNNRPRRRSRSPVRMIERPTRRRLDELPILFSDDSESSPAAVECDPYEEAIALRAAAKAKEAEKSRSRNRQLTGIGANPAVPSHPGGRKAFKCTGYFGNGLTTAFPALVTLTSLIGNAYFVATYSPRVSQAMGSFLTFIPGLRGSHVVAGEAQRAPMNIAPTLHPSRSSNHIDIEAAAAADLLDADAVQATYGPIRAVVSDSSRQNLPDPSIRQKHDSELVTNSNQLGNANVLERLNADSNQNQDDRPLVLPPGPSLRVNASFAACLFAQDDNAILNEWIAYHYYALNLRHLIVAVDPTSLQNPTRIFRRWRLLTDLEITEWHDPVYMPDQFLETRRPPADQMLPRDTAMTQNMPEEALLEISSRRYRQRVFLAKCMYQHRLEGRSWMMHIDPDEFVVPNKVLRQSLQPPSDLNEPGGLVKFVQNQVIANPAAVSYPCLSLPRVLFGTVEQFMTDEQQLVPNEDLDPHKFETLRWRFHGPQNDLQLNGNPNVLMDLAPMQDAKFASVVQNLHQPMPDYCRPKVNQPSNFQQHPLTTNRYIGTWERYSKNGQRSRAMYDAKAEQRAGQDDYIVDWLPGFVHLVGRKPANKLLGAHYLSATGLDASTTTQR